MTITTTAVYQPKWIIGADAPIDGGLLEDCRLFGKWCISDDIGKVRGM
jgi:hypothetical protein